MSRIVAHLAVFLLLLFGYLLGGNSAALSQQAVRSADPERIDEIITYLASDQLEGRLAGSPGAEMAARYIAEAFQSDGLAPVGDSYFQDFEITTAVSLSTGNALEIQTPNDILEMTVGQDFMPLFLSGDGSASGDVVFAGYGITAPEYNWDDYSGLDVRGKIVFCLRNEPRADDSTSPFAGNRATIYATLRWKAMNAENHGAAALLIATGPLQLVEGQEDKLIGLEGRGTLGEAGIPAVQLSQNAVGKLWESVDAPLSMYQVEMDRNMMSFGMPLENVKATVTVDLNRQKAVTSNVAAILPGIDPSLSDQYVVVGAHYDHLGWGTDSSLAEGEEPQIHPGADDNASGVAGLLELAGMFSSSPVRPMRSILFISFSAEELGALGSDWYVEHPLVPMENTVAMINMDMIGRVRPDENGTPVAWVYGLSTAAEWPEIVPSKAPDGQVALNLIPTPLAGGDYAPFQTAGIPSINFTSGSHEEFHRPTDRVGLINFAGEASLIGAVYQVIEKVADYPTRFAFQQPAGSTPPEGETGGNPPYTVYLGTVPDFTRTQGGFWISAVNEGSPAQAAGLKGGDRILRVGDYEVTDIYDYTNALGHFNPGDSTQIVVLRGDEEMTLTVTFGSREDGK